MRCRSQRFRLSLVRVIALVVPLAGCVAEHDIDPDPSRGGDDPMQDPPICSGSDSSDCAPAKRDGGVVRDAAAAPPDGAARDAVRPDTAAPQDQRPERPLASCPGAPPTHDRACSVAPDAICQYGDCSGSETLYAKCEDGRWNVAFSSCTPSYSMCPPQEPIAGELCASGWGTPSCSYDVCVGGAARAYRCAGGSWQLTQDCPGASCPAQQPANGSRCATEREYCEYGWCFGTPETTAECVLGSWRVVRNTCSPPDPCPAAAPSRDSPCQHVGESCRYDLAQSIATADCVNGRWQIATLAKDAGP